MARPFQRERTKNTKVTERSLLSCLCSLLFNQFHDSHGDSSINHAIAVEQLQKLFMSHSLEGESAAHHECVVEVKHLGTRLVEDDFAIEDVASFQVPAKTRKGTEFDSADRSQIVNVESVAGAVVATHGPRSAAVFARDVPPPFGCADRRETSR